MIKICGSNTIYVQYEKLYKDSCLQNDYFDSLIKRKANADDVIFIITKDNKIAAAASHKDICNNNIFFKVFSICENVFEQVKDYVYSNKLPDGVSFPVLDEKGSLLFPVVYAENIVLGQKHTDFPDYEKRFTELNGLDFTLLSKYNKFIFISAEEYSVAIAKILHQKYPDKKIVFLDSRSKYFLGEIPFRCLPMRGTAEKHFDLLCRWINGEKLRFVNRLISYALYTLIRHLEKSGGHMFITPNKEHFWPMDSIYNSGSVMYSLMWCGEKKNFGDKNRGKTVYLLDYACHNEGLVSIIRWTLAHIRWITERGGIPVVNLNKFPNQYLNSESENMWEYFFEQVSEVTVAEAYDSSSVICLSDNAVILGEAKINPYQRKWMNMPEKKEFEAIAKLNTETKSYISEHMPKEIGKSRILGVVARGTDFRNEAAAKINKEWRQNVVGIDKLVSACRHYMDTLNCEYIFLATEDADYFEKFEDCFGGKLLSVSQKRVSYNYRDNEYVQVKDLMQIKDGKEFGRNYLTVIQSLASCDALLYNINCGSVQLAGAWNGGKYEVCKCIDEAWA